MIPFSLSPILCLKLRLGLIQFVLSLLLSLNGRVNFPFKGLLVIISISQRMYKIQLSTWAHNLCLGRNRSGDQKTPFSDKRVRFRFDTNFLCGPEMTLELLMRKHWVKKGATRME